MIMTGSAIVDCGSGQIIFLCEFPVFFYNEDTEKRFIRQVGNSHYIETCRTS